MEYMKSDSKKYICDCQINPILPQDLKSHIKLPKIHKITTHKLEKKTNELDKYILTRLQVIKLCKSNSFWLTLLNYLPKIADNKVKFLQINEKSEIGQTLFGIQAESFLYNEKVDYQAQLIIYFKIMNHLNQCPLKEMSLFKHLKEQTITNFNYFLESRINRIQTLRLSPDRKTLVSGGGDSKLRFWNPITLQQIACLSHHNSTVKVLDIDNLSKYVLSGSYCGSIYLWSIKTKKLKNVFLDHEKFVIALNFIKGSECFVAGFGIFFKIWNIANKSVVFKVYLILPPISLSFNYRTKQIIVVFYYGAIQNFELNSSNPLKSTKYKNEVFSSHLAEDYGILMTGHNHGFVQFINSKTLSLMSSSKKHSDKVAAIDFCKNFKLFVTGSSDNTIIVWNLKFEARKTFKDSKFPIYDIQISYKDVYFGGENSAIQHLNILSSKLGASTNLIKIHEKCLCVSVKLNIIVYGFDELRVYCLKSLIKKNSKNFNSECKTIDRPCEIRILCIVNSFILCGTNIGYIFLVDSGDLSIKSKFLFHTTQVIFVSFSKDMKIMCYSYKNKSMIYQVKTPNNFLDLVNETIILGKFTSNYFVYVNEKFEANIYDAHFTKISQVRGITGCQYYFFKSYNFLLVKDTFFKLNLIDLRNPLNPIKTDYKFKELCKGNRHLKIYYEYLILFSLNYAERLS